MSNYSTQQKEDQGGTIFGYIEMINRKTHAVVKRVPIHKARILKFGRNQNLCDIIEDNAVLSGVQCKFWGVQFDENTLPICYIQDMSLNGTVLVSTTIKNNLSMHSQRKLTKFECAPLTDGDKIKFYCVENMCLRFVSNLQYANSNKNDQQMFKDLMINPFVHDEWIIQPIFIGSGTYGHVMITKAKTSYKLGAVKIVKNMKSNDRSLTQDQGNKNTMREAKILLELSHPNIIKFYSTVITKGISNGYRDFYIFQELAFGGDLFSYLAKTNSLVPVGEEEGLVIVFQIVLALRYLHLNNIVHRDLKLDNILLRTPEPCTKIILADFGIAKKVALSARLHTVIGTPEYCAPEVGFQKQRQIRKTLTETMTEHHRQEGYNSKCDLWSLGVITYIVLTGVSPFFVNNKAEMQKVFDKTVANNLNFEISQWNNVSAQAKDFVKCLLTIDIDKRLSASEAFEHPWISKHAALLKKIYKKILKEEPYIKKKESELGTKLDKPTETVEGKQLWNQIEK